MQLRVNLEEMQPDGAVIPTAGRLERFEPPAGPGVRVDTAGYGGYETLTEFDSLLAKVIARAGTYKEALDAGYRALGEFRIAGVRTNLPFLRTLLRHPTVAEGGAHTRFIEMNLSELLGAVETGQDADGGGTPAAPKLPAGSSPALSGRPPVSELRQPIAAPPGTVPVTAPLRGRVLEVSTATGSAIAVGSQLIVLEAMKMQHVINADQSGLVRELAVAPGDTVERDQPLLFLEPGQALAGAGDEAARIDLDAIRPDLAEVRERHAVTLDERRPRTVNRRHKRGPRTARENIADLCDPGSFKEYGALALAAQRRRRSLEDLIQMSPADGLVAGLASVNGSRFAAQDSRCAVMSYDYTVFAGTQGAMNHKKTDRLLGVVRELELPLIAFVEGGGGRPGDVDVAAVAGLDLHTFQAYAGLSGLAPRIAIVSGRCFAGNAAFAGHEEFAHGHGRPRDDQGRRSRQLSRRRRGTAGSPVTQRRD